MHETVLFSRTVAPQYVCRIPSMTLTPGGSILAFAGLRHGSAHDFGHETEMVMWRSADGGATWSEMRSILAREGIDIHSGPVVVDQNSSHILKFCRFWPGDMPPQQAQECVSTTPYHELAERGYLDHVLVSDDDGITWSEPQPVPLPFPEGVYSATTGNGVHGVQLLSGRLVIQGGYSVGVVGSESHRRSCVLLSDDGGAEWRLGAHGHTTHKREFVMAELAPGRVYFNFRNSTGSEGYRFAAISTDAGQSWGDLCAVHELPAPKCHGGLGSAPGTGADGKPWLVLSLPDRSARHPRPYDARARRDITAWLSKDGAASWPWKLLVHAGPVGYSDLAVDAHGNVHLVYERGTDDTTYHEELVYARFGVDRIGNGQ